MKILALVAVLALVCIALFVTGVFSPKRSRRLQERLRRVFRRAESKGDESAGRFGDMTRDSLEKARGAIDTSAEKGRDVHRKVPGVDSST